MKSVMNTYTGKSLDFLEPDPDAIDISDIARGLSNTCRFGAQARIFYSVAQHTVMVADLLRMSGREDLAPEGLHHDSHEAYMCDIPAPLRHCLTDYDPIATEVDRAIAQAFGLSGPGLDPESKREILRWDEAARAVEAVRLSPGAVSVVRSTAAVATDADVERAESLWGEPLLPDGAADLFMRAHEAAIRPAA